MKGQLWDICVIVLTFGFLIFIVYMAFGSVSETVKISAIVNSEKVTGVINVLQSSATETTQSYFLPDGECKLTISTYEDLAIVNFTSTAFGATQSSITEPLTTGVVVNGFEADCDKNKETRVYFQRCMDEIFIGLQEVQCS